MAADSAAAKRYAQAAFELAVESGTVAQWRADLEDIAAVLSDSQIASWLADRNVPEPERLAAVDRVLVLSPLAINLAKLLVHRFRSQDARAVALSFAKLADQHEGIVDAEVTTAVPIESAQLGNIEQQIASAIGKRVRLTTAVNPAILGGLVIRVGDQLLDGSIRSRLTTLKKQLEGAI